MPYVEGIDIWAGSSIHPIDWNAVVQAGIEFCIVRAGHCTSPDGKLAAHLQAAQSAGLITGVYWGGWPDSDAATQAKALAAVAEGVDMPAALDIEVEHGKSPKEVVAWMRTFVDAYEQTAGSPAMIYSYPFFVRAIAAAMTDDDRDYFAARELWLAAYTDAKAATTKYPPKAPAPWESWRIWQYGGDVNHSAVAGVAGACDRSVFMGTTDDLKAWLGI